jgi:two-component system chemotaxis response regulator CheB
VIRVVVADDSAVVAEVLRAVLESDPDLRVVGHARNGAEAVELARRLRPDVLLMDVRMPVMDGIAATTAIMAEAPVPILVVAASVHEDTSVAFRAIQAGAVDVVEKPTGTLSSDYARLDLIRHVKLVARVPPIRRGRLPAVDRQGEQGEQGVSGAPWALRAPGASPGGVVALGASTGGPPALAAILSAFPPSLPSPVLAVQHISPGFLPGFVEWLGSVVPLPVRVAVLGEILESGVVYFPPEDRHLGLTPDGRALTSDDPPEGGHRPSVSWLFRSVARARGARAVGVLLTGMGSDGASGLRELRHAGGHAICQDEGTSVVWGMPQQAVLMGAADAVLPLTDIAAAILTALGPARASL